MYIYIFNLYSSIKGGQLVGSWIGVSMYFPLGTVSLPLLVVMSCFGYYNFFELRKCPHSHFGQNLFYPAYWTIVPGYYVL